MQLLVKAVGVMKLELRYWLGTLGGALRPVTERTIYARLKGINLGDRPDKLNLMGTTQGSGQQNSKLIT